MEANAYEGEVRLSSLVYFLFTQANGFQIIKCLAMQFPQVQILEQCGDFYKLRVPKGG